MTRVSVIFCVTTSLKLEEQLRNAIRPKQLSYRTEETSAGLLRRYMLWHVEKPQAFRPLKFTHGCNIERFSRR